MEMLIKTKHFRKFWSSWIYKDELAELLSESEDTDTDSAGMDALTEALDALEDAAELIDEVLD